MKGASEEGGDEHRLSRLGSGDKPRCDVWRFWIGLEKEWDTISEMLWQPSLKSTALSCGARERARGVTDQQAMGYFDVVAYRCNADWQGVVGDLEEGARPERYVDEAKGCGFIDLCIA